MHISYKKRYILCIFIVTNTVDNSDNYANMKILLPNNRYNVHWNAIATYLSAYHISFRKFHTIRAVSANHLNNFKYVRATKVVFSIRGLPNKISKSD